MRIKSKLLAIGLLGFVSCSGSKPITVRGSVYDLADDSAISGARVVALSINNSPVSNVAISDDDGNYELTLEKGTNSFTLRADVSGFLTFPSGLQQALPVDTSDPVEVDGKSVVDTALTDIGMNQVPDGTGTASIYGNVDVPGGVSGVLVVAETGTPAVGSTAIADKSGDYRIFNLAAGAYTVQAYAKGANFEAASVDLADGDETNVDIESNGDETATLDGSVQIVNAPGGSTTSIILVVESTFNENIVRGESPPGLRAPESGTDPDVSGSFSISGIPAGKYVVLAAFENDGLVRDPDTCISGTQILHQEFAVGETVDLSSGFKITGALDVISPGADGPEIASSATPTFTWVDDSSEDAYHVTVFDTLGNSIWTKDIPGESGSDPSVTYDGPTLNSGEYYQFRAVSSRTTGMDTCEISQTEDLKGVFIVP